MNIQSIFKSKDKFSEVMLTWIIPVIIIFLMIAYFSQSTTQATKDKIIDKFLEILLFFIIAIGSRIKTSSPTQLINNNENPPQQT